VQFVCVKVVCQIVKLNLSTLSTDFICSPWSDLKLLTSSAHTDCQGKRAQGKRGISSLDRWMPVRRSMSKFKYTCTRGDVWCHHVDVRNMDPADWKMKAKRYSGSTSLGNYAATTKAGAAINSTLPDQLWAFFVGVHYPCFFPTLPPLETFLRTRCVGC
jgi:hypothetical protein